MRYFVVYRVFILNTRAEFQDTTLTFFFCAPILFTIFFVRFNIKNNINDVLCDNN